MNGAFPWHALWTSLLLGFLGAAFLLYLLSFRRYETYRTAARFLLLVTGLLALGVLLTGATSPPTEPTVYTLFRQHQALGVTTGVLVVLTALFALFEPLASWMPGFTVSLLLLALLAAGSSWVFGHRLREALQTPPVEILEEPQEEEVVPDTGELWWDDEESLP